MNNWEILLIPLIALGAWILSTIFKTDEDSKAKGRVRRSEGRTSVRPPRRPEPVRDKYRDEKGRRRDMPEGMESHTGSVRPTQQQPIIAPRRPAPTTPLGLPDCVDPRPYSPRSSRNRSPSFAKPPRSRKRSKHSR